MSDTPEVTRAVSAPVLTVEQVQALRLERVGERYMLRSSDANLLFKSHEALRADRDAALARLEQQTNYSITLQRMIEHLARNTPLPEDVRSGSKYYATKCDEVLDQLRSIAADYDRNEEDAKEAPDA